MPTGTGLEILRALSSIVGRMETAPEIEKELNEQLAGKSFLFENYRGNEASISIESITVRPKYSPKGGSKGPQQVEPDNFFTSLEKERSVPNLRERFKAILTGHWITVVRLEIKGGDANILRPPGLSVNYMSTREAVSFGEYSDSESISAFSVPSIRVIDSHQIEQDRLLMKLSYDGSPGEYRRRIHSGVDILIDMQEEMEIYALRYLIEIHHSGQIEDSDDFSWPKPERVRQLGNFLFGGPIDLDGLADQIEELKRQIKEGEHLKYDRF